MINEFLSLNLAPKNLIPLSTRIADGSAAVAVVAGVAGKRIRLWWASLSQQGTAAADASLRALTGGTDFFKVKLTNDGRQAFFNPPRGYYELADGAGLFAVIDDQATDSFDVNILYTVEDN